MSHKGYTARIEFNERDNIFVGRVLGLHTMISFHGETVAELRSEFETAISEFLRDCKEQGVRPEKPASGKLMLRVPPEVLQVSPQQEVLPHLREYSNPWCMDKDGKVRFDPKRHPEWMRK